MYGLSGSLFVCVRKTSKRLTNTTPGPWDFFWNFFEKFEKIFLEKNVEIDYLSIETEKSAKYNLLKKWKLEEQQLKLLKEYIYLLKNP